MVETIRAELITTEASSKGIIINGVNADFIQVRKQEPSKQKREKRWTPTENTEDDTYASSGTLICDDETDNSDVELLAICICREAGGSSEHIQKMVASVVMNRVASSVFPDTIYGVIMQPYQYNTMWIDGADWPSWATDEIRASCRNSALAVANGYRACPESVVYQAEFQQGSGIYEQIDDFYFCYE